MQKFLELCSPSSLNYVWLLKHPGLEKSRLPVNMLSNQTVHFTPMTSLHQFEKNRSDISWESWRQMLQVSRNMFFCAEFVSNTETWCTQCKLCTGSSFVTDYAFLWQTVDRCSNSAFEPLSIPSFHFLSELQLKKSLCRSLLLVIHHHHLLTSFYSRSKDTFCHLWPVSHKGEKVGGWGCKPGWKTPSLSSVPI